MANSPQTPNDPNTPEVFAKALLDLEKQRERNERRKKQERENRKKLAPLEARVQMGDMRNRAMADMAEKTAVTLQRKMSVEESRLQGLIESTLTDGNIKLHTAISEYQDEIMDLYYGSTKEIDSVLKNGERKLETEYIPLINLTIAAIERDDRLTDDIKAPLLSMAHKAKDHILDRIETVTKLKEKATAFIKSDVVVAALAGAATRSPLIALATFAFKNRKQKTSPRVTRQRIAERDLKQRRRMQQGTPDDDETPQESTPTAPGPPAAPAGPQGGVTTDPGPTTPKQDTSAPTVTKPDLSAIPELSSKEVVPAKDLTIDTTPLTGGLGSNCCESLLEILGQHTKLLTGIFDSTKMSVKLQERLIQLQQLAAEESAMETPTSDRPTPPSASSSASNAGSFTTPPKEKESDGILDTAMSIAGGAGALGLLGRAAKGARAGGKFISSIVQRKPKILTVAATGMAAAGTLSLKLAETATKHADSAIDAGKIAARSIPTTTKNVGKLISASIAKRVPKTIVKLFGKSILFLGPAIGAGFAISRLLKGDMVGAGLEAASGLGGPLTALPLTVTSLARDVYYDAYGIQPEQDPLRNERMNEVTEGVKAAVANEVNKLGMSAAPKPTPTPAPKSVRPPAPPPKIESKPKTPTPPVVRPPSKVKTNPSVTNTSLGFDYESYRETLAKRESNGDYNAVNQLGYIGKYQFGAMALEDLGFLKKGASKLHKGNPKKILNDPSNWTIPGGRTTFLQSPQMQDDAMLRLTTMNLKTLRRIGVVTATTTPTQVSSYLAGAHLVGPGGVKKSLSGADIRDANKVSATEYMRLGAESQSPMAMSMGDAMQSRRNALRNGIVATTASNTQPRNNQAPMLIQGGSTTIVGGMGNSRPNPTIPAPIDREPTLRRVLDGS